MSITSTIHDLTGWDVEGTFGVEVELEASNNFPREVAWWDFKRDGSLRGSSAEYVLSLPQNKDDVRKALVGLEKDLDNFHTNLTPSVRTGVHIHMNKCNWTVKEIATFLSIYYIFEEAIVRKCGESRSGNLFCLRLKDSEVIMDSLIKWLGGRVENTGAVAPANIRYAAMNLNALHNRGSLEFRAIATPLRVSSIFRWVELFDELRASSKKFDNPREVIESFSQGGFEEFINRVFCKDTQKFLDLTEDTHYMLQEGVYLCQEIAYCRNWR